jgi:cysteine-rich repeat protein
MTPANTIPASNVDPYITININNPTAASGEWWSGRYRYSATNESGGHSTCLFTISEANANNQTGGVTTISNTYRRTMYAYACSPGDTLYTTEINYPTTCNDSVDIEPLPPTYCGDGIQQTPNDDGQNEECDDGNTIDDDACSNTCELPNPPLTYCGDGIQQTPNDNGQNEECDDGNSIDNDSCQNDCTLPPPPLTYCGDGIEQHPNDYGQDEACDNGEFNGTPGNDCSLTCEIVEEPPLFCKDLYIIEPTSIAPENAGDLTAIVISAEDNEGNKWNGKYTYWTEAENCEFRETSEFPWSTRLSTTAKAVEVQSCVAGDEIFITENDYQETCRASLPIGNPCNTLNITTPVDLTQEVIATQPFPLSFESLGFNQRNIPGVFEISATDNNDRPSTCQFYSTEERAESETSGDSSMTTTLHNVWVNECELGDTITVQDINASICVDQISGTPEPVRTYCGDGIPQNPNDEGQNEVCDDGNTIDDDACSNTCELPPPVIDQCIGLQIDPPAVAQKSLPQLFTITSDPGEWPGPWTWESRRLNGELHGNFVANNGDLVGNPITSSDQSVGYFGGAENDHITVVNTNDEDCNAEANIIGNTGTCTSNCGVGGCVGNNCGGGGGETYCGDGIKQSPNERRNVYEECDEGPNGGPTDDGLWCNNVCQLQINFPQPGDTLEKKVTTWNFGFMEVGVTSINGSCFDSEEDCPSYAHDFDYALYELTYTPDLQNSNPPTIFDDIKDGINGSQGGIITFHEPVNADPDPVEAWTDNGRLYVYLDKDTHEEKLSLCAREYNEVTDSLEITSVEPCYTGDIANSLGITLENLEDATPIKIQYVGKVRNGSFSCEALSTDVCPVQGFTNTAETNTGLNASADLTVICPYLLTRNAGDVYLGSSLQSYDLSCYYDNDNNSDGLVLAKNNSFFSRFQSYINKSRHVKEIVFDLKTVWKRATIENTVSTYNTEAVTRNNKGVLKNLPSSNPDDGVKLKNFGDLANLDQYKTSKQNVYEIDGTNLTMALTDKVPAGAYTFIVRNANLNIRKNIEYSAIPSSNGNFNINNPKEIPSIAFIVINGNINVENNPPQTKVTKMAGVYYVQGGADAEGVITGDWTDPFTSLTIQGSVYGNINPLLEARTFAGPANYDQGNVVIRYDERIILNTPPGLEDYVDVQSERVAR